MPLSSSRQSRSDLRRVSVGRWVFGLLEWVRGSLWAVPASLALAAVVLARGAVAVDERGLLDDLWLTDWLYAGSPGDARALLGTLSGSTITVAGVVFSITVVALSFATTHLGPRLLRVFMRDRGTQVVLGSFVAVYLYELLVMSSIQGSLDTDAVPRLAVSLGLGLATLSFGLLIYFFHHVARSMQVENVVASVRSELDTNLERLFPEEYPEGDEERPEEERPEGFADDDLPEAVAAERSGYVQAIDYARLERLAGKGELRLRCEVRSGHFVTAREPLVRGSAGLSDDARDEVRATFVIGGQRTGYQDIEFAIRQLVEVALRALSSGVNDPFTAILCIDNLTDALAVLARRCTPAWSVWADDDGQERLASPGVTFAGAMDSAWNQLRQHAGDQPAVAIRMVECLEVLYRAAACEPRRRHIAQHAARLARATAEWPESEDRASFAERWARLDVAAPDAG